MGNYLKNKNFMPRKFINNQNFKKNKGSKRGVVILIIVNLLFLPLTIDSFFKNKKVKVLEVPKVLDTGIAISGVIKWIEEIDVDVLSMSIRNNSGTMEVKSMEKVYSLEEHGEVIINNINSVNGNNYNLQLIRKN